MESVAIDTSGKWWKGTEFADLAEYVRLYTAEGYVATDIRQSTCANCGGTVFRLYGDTEEGAARRVCISCKQKAFICDSEEFWEDADPQQCVCPCKGKEFEVAVGFSFRETGDVKWVTVGQRCIRCGTLGSFVDWKIDYSPTDHLLKKV